VIGKRVVLYDGAREKMREKPHKHGVLCEHFFRMSGQGKMLGRKV